MRIWGRIFKDNHLITDTVVEDLSEDTRTHKVLNSLDKVCETFNLSRPIWLNKNIDEFKRFSFSRFYQDNFIESVEFDYMEIRVIEED